MAKYRNYASIKIKGKRATKKVKKLSFCPNDGTLLMPKKEDGKSQLICRKCGYKTEPTDAKAYRLVVKIPHTPKDKTIVVEGENEKKLEIDEDEREELKRQALEFYAEEGET